MKLYTRRDMARLASIGVAGIATGGLAVEFPSSVSSRSRGLLALKAQNWRASGGGGWEPVDGSYIEQPSAANWMFAAAPSEWDSLEVEFFINADYSICGAKGALNGILNITGSSTNLYVYTNVARSIVPLGVPGKHIVVFDFTSGDTYVDGDAVASGASKPSVSEMVLFSRLNGNNDVSRAGARIYRATFKSGPSVTCDYRPRQIDGVAGFYDVVGGVFVTKATSTMADYIYGVD